MLSAPSPRGRTRKWLLLAALSGVLGALLMAWTRAPLWAGWRPAVFEQAQDFSLRFGLLPPSMYLAWLASALGHTDVRDAIRLGVRRRVEITRHLVWPATLLGAAMACVPTALLMVLDDLALRQRDSTTHGALDPLVAVLWTLGTAGASVTLLGFAALIGTWVRSILAVLLAPTAIFVALTLPLLTLDPPRWSGLYAEQQILWLDAQPSGVSAGARAVFWSACAIVVLAVLVGAPRVTRIAVLAVAGAVSFAILEGPTTLKDPTAASEVCRQGTVLVCTTGTGSAGLPEFTRLVDEGLADIPPPMRPDVVITDDTLSSHDGRRLTVAPIGGTSSPTNLPDRTQTLVAMGDALFLETCGPQSSWVPQTALELAWLQQLGVAPDAAHQPWDLPALSNATDAQRGQIQTGIAAYSRMTADERRDWLDTHRAEIAQCSLPPEALAR